MLLRSANYMLLAQRFLRKLSWNSLFRVSSSHNLFFFWGGCHNFLMCFTNINLNGNFTERLLWKNTQKLISKFRGELWRLHIELLYAATGSESCLNKCRIKNRCCLHKVSKTILHSWGNNYE